LAGGTTGYDLGANLLNFGALIAFMGVNAAAFVRYYLHEPEKKFGNLAPPVLGFIICFFLWISLSPKALVFGAIWMAVGIAIGAWKTKGFRGNLVDFELPPDE
jgi:putrescine importer